MSSFSNKFKNRPFQQTFFVRNNSKSLFISFKPFPRKKKFNKKELYTSTFSIYSSLSSSSDLGPAFLSSSSSTCTPTSFLSIFFLPSSLSSLLHFLCSSLHSLSSSHHFWSSFLCASYPIRMHSISFIISFCPNTHSSNASIIWVKGGALIHSLSGSSLTLHCGISTTTLFLFLLPPAALQPSFCFQHQKHPSPLVLSWHMPFTAADRTEN